MRELIQNATDAISARRVVAHGKFAGHITVRLARRANGGWVLQVDDDGVGMSQAILSTDLLDFGKSFWVSERASREFPGMHASGYSPVGHFGIGFFSIFMAARKVSVFFRRFDKGLEDVRCLSFENGISLRPTLSADRPPDFGMHVCTRVGLELKPGVIQHPDRIEIRCNLLGHETFCVRFKDYVAAMVAGVNVSVFVESAIGCVKVHEQFPPEAEEIEQWLRSLSYVAAGVNKQASVGLTRAVSRLRPIRDGDKVYGLAAIDALDQSGGLFLSGKSVGGLVPPHDRYDASFVGVIDYTPASAKREAGEIAAPKQSVDAWLVEQLRLLKKEGMSQIESLVASYSVCQLGYDPKDILLGLLVASSDRVNYWPMRAIGAKLETGLRLGFAVSAEFGILDQYTDAQLRVPGTWMCTVVRNGKFNEAKFSGGVPAEAHSLIGVVHRVLKESGYNPQWRISEGAYSSFLGRGDILEVAV